MKSFVVFISTWAIAANIFAQPTPPKGFSGIVRDRSGKPAAGVHVTFYPGEYYSDEDYNYHEAITGADGRYEIAPPKKVSGFHFGLVFTTNCILARDLEHGLAAVQAFPIEQTNVDLTLEPAITLSGSVQATKGAPVAGAEIELSFLSGGYLPKMRPPFRGDEKGRFRIPALPRGIEYAVLVNANGYGSGHGKVEAQDTKRERYEFPTFMLKTTDRKVAGRVLDKEGKPLVGTRMNLFGPDQPENSNTITDQEGKFQFDSVCDSPLKISAFYSDPHDPKFYLSSGGGIDFEAGNTNILIELR